jgi:hypothetical protein
VLDNYADSIGEGRDAGVPNEKWWNKYNEKWRMFRR